MAAAARPMPLKPAVDAMHVFGAPSAAATPSAAAHSSLPRAATAHPSTSSSPSTGMAQRSLPLVVRQQLTQMATQEGIRRAEVARLGGEGTAAAAAAAAADMLEHSSNAAVTKQQATTKPQQPAVAKKKKPLPALPVEKPRKENWLEALRSASSINRKANMSARKPEGAAAEGRAAEGVEAANCNAQQSQPQFKVLYRYNEGYTNAVKRPLLMRELL